MIDPHLEYSEIAEQLTLIEQHLIEQPLCTDAVRSQKAVDALICARTVITQLSAMATRQAETEASTTPAP